MTAEPETFLVERTDGTYRWTALYVVGVKRNALFWLCGSKEHPWHIQLDMHIEGSLTKTRVSSELRELFQKLFAHDILGFTRGLPSVYEELERLLGKATAIS